jgi:hypothetical protein
MTATVEIILWRDIPAQVIAREGGDVHREEMAQRFQLAIDQAATRAGLVAADAYLGEWRKERRTGAGTAEAAVAAEVARMDLTFTDEVLARYVANEGKCP